MIDYVGDAYGGPSDENEFAVLNVVANPSFTLLGEAIDATNITPALLDLDRDAERALDSVPGLIAANWVEVRL